MVFGLARGVGLGRGAGAAAISVARGIIRASDELDPGGSPVSEMTPTARGGSRTEVVSMVLTRGRGVLLVLLLKIGCAERSGVSDLTVSPSLREWLGRKTARGVDGTTSTISSHIDCHVMRAGG